MLFTFAGGDGHADPLLPVARAAVAAGHTVAFACGPSMAGKLAAAGFAVLPTSDRVPEPPRRLPLREVDVAREDRELGERFARHGARELAARKLTLFADWQPDVVVRDETDFGSAIAAERLNLPHASVLVIAAGSFVRAETVGQPLHELRAEHGLPPDPELAMLRRYLVLSPFPPSFRDPAFPLPDTAHTFRLPKPPAPPVAPWPVARPDEPTVYVTLGTVFNLESGDLFARVLRGLRDLPVNLVVTVGQQIDPAEFGPQPVNVHIARYIPQAEVLPHCQAVVSHGGSGSVLGALSYGLPSVLLPMGADQPHNAARCADLGVSQVLDPVAATPETVRAAVSTVLTEPRHRRAAERIRDEIAAQPGPEHAVTLLERLAADRQPVLRARTCR